MLLLAACSASNYLLGLTPVELGPLVIGTVAGMSVWSILYASLGGASKALLESGADLDVLLAGETTEQVSLNECDDLTGCQCAALCVAGQAVLLMLIQIVQHVSVQQCSRKHHSYSERLADSNKPYMLLFLLQILVRRLVSTPLMWPCWAWQLVACWVRAT